MKISRHEKDEKIEENIIKDKKNLYRPKKEIYDTAIKDVRNLFRLKKEINDITMKDIRNLFRLKKENTAMKNRIIRDIRILFWYEEEDYYKPTRVGNFMSNNYIEYESNGNTNKTLSVKKYLNKIEPYFKDIINNLIQGKFS